MNPNLRQVRHNESFHRSICEQSPDAYYDWKIVCLFYCGYHLIQTLAIQKGVKVGNRHRDILWNMNPRNTSRTMQVKRDIFNAFDALFEYSQTARYLGFTDFDAFQELKKADYRHSISLYKYIRNYVQSNGVEVDFHTA